MAKKEKRLPKTEGLSVGEVVFIGSICRSLGFHTKSINDPFAPTFTAIKVYGSQINKERNYICDKFNQRFQRKLTFGGVQREGALEYVYISKLA